MVLNPMRFQIKSGDSYFKSFSISSLKWVKTGKLRTKLLQFISIFKDKYLHSRILSQKHELIGLYIKI